MRTKGISATSVLAIVLIVGLLLAIAFGAPIVFGAAATSTPAPNPPPTPTYDQWQPGQSGHLRCEGGWEYGLWGQAVYLACQTSDNKTVPQTPVPGHQMWLPGQNGYILCQTGWQVEDNGQSIFLSCPNAKTAELANHVTAAAQGNRDER